MTFDINITAKKTIRDALIFILPIVATVAISSLGNYANLTIGAAIGMGIKALVDYLQHRK